LFGYSYVLIDIMVYSLRGNVLTPLNKEGMKDLLVALDKRGQLL